MVFQLDLVNQITYEKYCPLMASTADDWIYQAPIIIVLLINSMFLVKIMWVSVVDSECPSRRLSIVINGLRVAERVIKVFKRWRTLSITT